MVQLVKLNLRFNYFFAYSYLCNLILTQPIFNSIVIIKSYVFSDEAPDLYLTTDDGYEVWLSDSNVGSFVFNRTIPFPDGLDVKRVGQTAFMDLQLKGRMDHVVPVCFDDKCTNSTIYFYDSTRWYNLGINFHNGNILWGFVPPKSDKPYLETITLRPGDFNMDGYPDLLCTLCSGGNPAKTKVFLMENVPSSFEGFDRTFKVEWNLMDAMNGINGHNVMGAFYDFYQNGILDVLLVSESDKDKKEYAMSAFRNSLDYDANFLKVSKINIISAYFCIINKIFFFV